MALTFDEPKPKRHIGLWIFLAIVVIVVGTIGWAGYQWYKTGQIPSIPFIKLTTSPAVNNSKVTSTQIAAYKVADAEPRYLTSNALGSNKARIYPEGLDNSNMIILPKNVHDVSLYNKSSLPGSGGVIIITGYGSVESPVSALAKLSSLKKNDGLTIETGDGTTDSYSVQSVENLTIAQYNTTGTKELAQPAIEGDEGLNIVVNSGKWSSDLNTYDHRLLVRAVLQ
jgi:hypothetical protein